MATLKNTTINDTGFLRMPPGTTAQRPAVPQLGMMRYNTTLDVLEQYTLDGWQGIDAPPIVTTISGTIFSNENSTITINGSNFKSGAVVSIEGAAVGGIPRVLSTTYVNSTQLTAATNAASVNYITNSTFDVKVTNPSGLSSVATSAGTTDTRPSWTTPSGLLGYISDLSRGIKTFTVVATDPDSNPITYSVVSGSLPTNMTINSSTGVISGTPNAVGSSTTSSFTIRATANGVSVDRTFSITVLAPGKTTFTHTGTNQTFNIPTGVDRIRVKMWGAAGGTYYDGTGNNGQGGAGGYTETTFNVLTGETTLTVIVGSGSEYTTAGIMGGAGNGGNGGCAGGGASILVSGTLSNAAFTQVAENGPGSNSVVSSELANKAGATQVIAVAGGGGGAGWYIYNYMYAGNGGGLLGGNAANGYYQATGGTQSAGGVSYGGGTNPTAGKFKAAGVTSTASGGSGGGGGGWYGGGTGWGGSNTNSSGAGGSGFVGYANGSTSTVLTPTSGDGASYTDTITRTNGTRTYTNSQCLRNGQYGTEPPNTSDADYGGNAGRSAPIFTMGYYSNHGRVVLIY